MIEILITIVIFIILTGGIYLTYANLLEVIAKTRNRTLATSLLNKEIEYVRNLKYDDVGIVGGAPAGQIPATKTVTYEGQQFTVSAFVRNIDDAFDGRATGTTPTDTAPGDYRLVELQANCTTCFKFKPVIITTRAAPQNLESSTKNGSLFINVFNASGNPVANANILVKNTILNPTITINDTTNSSGTLQLVDIPTSTNGYQVFISKDNYSSAQTYAVSSTNPNPAPRHATVASQQVTLLSFGIDKVSQIDVQTQDQYCAGVPNIDFTQNGAKLIGVSPNVLKYSKSFVTDSGGQASRTGLEWDNYTFINTDTGFDVAGNVPSLPITLNPNTTTSIAFLMEPKISSSSLLVSTVDSSGAPISGVSVKIDKISGGFSTSSAQFTITSFGNLPYSNSVGITTSGGLRLSPGSAPYPTTGGPYYRTFAPVDFGTSTVDYTAISWNPSSQPAGTLVRIQLGATNDGNSPATFTGPDGTSNSYYTVSGGALGASYDNKRYLSMKIFLSTTDANVSPSLTSVTLTYVGPSVVFTDTKQTGQKKFVVTDWSGNAYANQDGNIQSETVLGRLTLKNSGGQYPTSTNSYLESNTIDFGTANISYKSLSWNPTSQPSGATLKFHLAGASSVSGPFTFTGPDGTSSTYYTTNPVNLPTTYNANQYLRYKVFLNTTNQTVTPTLNDLAIAFESDCVPSGQAFFPGLSTGNYLLTLNKSGHSTVILPFTIVSGWQEKKITW